jgi:hypothetical protein
LDERKSDDEDRESEQDQGFQKKKSKSKKRMQASVSDSLLLSNIAPNAHSINAEFIPSAYAMLGPDLHEGGAAKKQRDEIYLSTLSALNIPDARANPPSASDDGIRARLRLVKANMQTVDQVRVRAPFLFPVLHRSDCD